MVRKQVYIDAEQNRRLKQIAEDLGTSEAELVRRGLDYLERVEVKRETVTPPVDLSAWEEEKQFIAERMEKYKDVPHTGRTNAIAGLAVQVPRPPRSDTRAEPA